jgi:hypothetical protein
VKVSRTRLADLLGPPGGRCRTSISGPARAGGERLRLRSSEWSGYRGAWNGRVSVRLCHLARRAVVTLTPNTTRYSQRRGMTRGWPSQPIPRRRADRISGFPKPGAAGAK